MGQRGADGELVVGAPGAGKTTYCDGVQQLLQAAGRSVAVVNLDPANDALPYECAIDVSDLVSLEEVQSQLSLGPNGGLLYCLEYLEENLDWLLQRLEKLQEATGGCTYLVFDCPGQLELFSVHSAMQNILNGITRKANCQLCVVNLVDSHFCTDGTKMMTAWLGRVLEVPCYSMAVEWPRRQLTDMLIDAALTIMLHLEMPHVNVLSKVDLLTQMRPLKVPFDVFAGSQSGLELAHILASDAILSARHQKLSQLLCEVIDDFSLLSFTPLAVEDKAVMQGLLALVDRANGCLYAPDFHRSSGAHPDELYGTGFESADSESLWEMVRARYLDAADSVSGDDDTGSEDC